MINDARAGQGRAGRACGPEGQAAVGGRETQFGARLALGAFLEAGTETAWGLGSAVTGNWQLGHGKGHSLLGLGTGNGHWPCHRQWHQGKLDNNTENREKKHNAANVNTTWKHLAKH